MKLSSFASEYFSNCWRLRRKRVALVADVHCPYIHENTWNKLLKVCRDEKIDTVISGGDHFDNEIFANVVGYDVKAVGPVHQLSNVLKVSDYMMNELFKVTKELYIFLGSHDRRFLKTTNYQIDEGLLERLITNETQRKHVHISRFNFMYLNNSYHLIHPDKYAKAPALKARQYYTNEPDYHTFVAHIHQFHLAKSDSGRHWLGTLPVMVDHRKVPWANLIKSTYPAWNTGFATIIDNEQPPRFYHT